jgi:DNA-directed RNA polymerase II subunit RPB7
MFFASNLQDHLLLRLHAEVEGTCSGRFGYIISVVEVVSVSKGVLKAATGHAEFDIMYKAIVFKPFKNQVVDGVVSTVNKVAIHCIHSKMGFFADIGPLQIFVSSHVRYDAFIL